MGLRGLLAAVRRRRLWRERLRAMRVWRAALKNRPFAVYDVLREIEYAENGLPVPDLGGAFPDIADAAATCLRQRLFFALRHRSVHKSILAHAAGRTETLDLPLSDTWLAAARKAGLPVDERACRRRFRRLVLVGLLRSARNCLRLLRRGDGLVPDAPYVAVLQMGERSLPPANVPPGTRDLASWAVEHGRLADPSVAAVLLHCPSVTAHRLDPRTVVSPTPLPPLTPERRRAFRRRAAGRILRVAGQLLLGRWQGAFMLDEVLSRDHAALCPPDTLARHYFFTVSDWLVRPLWSYAVEASGSAVSIVYYSVNSALFAPDVPPFPQYGSGEGIATWPRYVVMSDDMADALRSQRRAPALPMVLDPYIGMIDHGAPVPDLDAAHTVAVFDVVPVRLGVLADLGHLTPYENEAVARRFLTDIRDALGRRGLSMAFKQKRLRDQAIAPAYRRFIEGLEADPTILRTAPELGAERLCAKTAATIAFPFTTPAVVAKAQGRPAIYYDPTGRLAAVAPHRHGVPVVSGRDALGQWLETSVATRES